MSLLVSFVTQLLLAVTLVLAAALGGLVAYFYLRARKQEETTAALSQAEQEELRRRDNEIATIRQRIEEIYDRQLMGSETQNARIGQHIEELQQHLQARGRQIEGLQSQLRYEMKRREEELRELRNQLREAVEVFSSRGALPAAASRPLPPATASEPAPEPPAETPPPPEEPVQPPSFAPLATFVADEDDEIYIDLPQGITDLDSEPAPPIQTPDPADWDETTFEWDSFSPDTDEPTPFFAAEESAAPEEHPSAELPSAAEPFSAPAFSPELPDFNPLIQWSDFEIPESDGPHSGDGMASAAASSRKPQPAAPPPGADDLTQIPNVDAATQARLYALGVTTLDEIARWNRTDARRIAAQVEQVNEDRIMNEWVFEAQSILFDRYQAQLQEQRRRRTAD